jgi:hypothetical protein
VLYETCEEVNAEFWQELLQLQPTEVARRTGVAFEAGSFHLAFLNRRLTLDPQERLLRVTGPGTRHPDFRLCLTTLLYLARVDPAALGPLVSPLELTGGATFFTAKGPHALPRAFLEERFGQDLPGFFRAGELLGATRQDAGDAALTFQVFPGLALEVILWLTDEEFPAQVSFRVPGALERVWHLDAVLALLQLLARELLAVAA